MTNLENQKKLKQHENATHLVGKRAGEREVEDVPAGEFCGNVTFWQARLRAWLRAHGEARSTNLQARRSTVRRDAAKPEAEHDDEGIRHVCVGGGRAVRCGGRAGELRRGDTAVGRAFHKEQLSLLLSLVTQSEGK